MNLLISQDGACLAERQISRMTLLPKRKVRVLVVGGGPRIRYVSMVTVGGQHYYADRVAGTLYQQDTGHGLTSTNMRIDLATLVG